MSKYVVMEGNATADAELRYSQNGKKIASVNVACAERTKGENGEWGDDETMFVRITTFDKQAEILAASIRKGDTVVFAGRLTQRQYTAKQSGEVRTSTECIPDNIGLSLRWKPALSGSKHQAAAQQQAQQVPGGQQGYADDTPF